LRDGVGAVGAKLFFANGHLQHSGVILGIGPEAIAGHVYRGAHKWEVGDLARVRLTQNDSAVSAACLAIKRERFEQVIGFNESDLTVALNDVDLCLKRVTAGSQRSFSLANTNFVTGPAMPSSIGFANRLTTAAIAAGTWVTRPSTIPAITPSSASWSLANSAWSASTWRRASPWCSGRACWAIVSRNGAICSAKSEARSVGDAE
jgi:hypothetical protein